MTQSAHAHRIVVDGSRCDGRGICALIVPERISLDRWGYASLESEAIIDARSLARARRAVLACPARALALVAVNRDEELPQSPRGRRRKIVLRALRGDTTSGPPPANARDIGDS